MKRSPAGETVKLSYTDFVQNLAMTPGSLSQMYVDCIRAAGNHPACGEFFQTIRPTVFRIASRVAYQYSSPGDIDDVVQEISLKMIASGQSIVQSVPADSHAALAYFSVLAANSARDFFRARGATKRGRGSTVSMETVAAMAAGRLGIIHDFDRDLLLGRIEESLPPDRREQIVFRLYYRQGLTAKEISSIPALALSVKGVESMILRITKKIRERLQEPGKDSRTVEGVGKPKPSQ